MTENKRKYVKNRIIWDKVDIAAILGVDYVVLNRFLTDKTKQEVGWVKGRAAFNDFQTFRIIKELKQLWTDDTIISKMYAQKQPKTAS